MKEGIPNQTRQSNLTKCSSCFYCHKFIHLNPIDRSEEILYICGIFGIPLADIPAKSRISIEKRCEFNYINLELKTLIKEENEEDLQQQELTTERSKE